MSLESRTNITIRKRIVWLLLIIFLIQAVIVGRYAWVQIVWAPKLQQWAVDQWTNDTVIDAKRGIIYDRNMNPLAVSGNVERIDALLKEINKAEKDGKTTKAKIASQIAQILDMNEEEIIKKLNKKLKSGAPMASVTIARRVEREQSNKIRELKLPGIIITEDTKRYYPNGTLLSQVLGNTNIDGDGRAGLEYYYNNELKGVPGRYVGETDAYHRELPNNLTTYVSPQNGYDLVLTIDESIQYFAEKAIEQGLVEYKAKRISVLVMDPKTGEILAMANKPDYDPNNPVQGSVEEAMKLWKNRTVNENFEPGSILKVITAAAALEEDLVNDSSKFVCNGSLEVGGRRIKCWKTAGHGTQTFPQILQNSCNVGFMLLGDKLGKDKLYKYFNAFGFGKRANIDYPGEEKGIIMPIEKVGPVELANESFGQGIAVTMVQYLTALSAIANDGKMMEPHLVKRILYVDENGTPSVIKEVEPKAVKQVISQETSRKLRPILESVVTTGAGKRAYIEGYHLGGKTGTAQKVIDGKYVYGRYISSFSAIAPCNDPKLAIIVSIDEPDPSNYYSGSTATLIAKQIFEDIFRYLDIQPDTQDINNPKVNREVVVPEIRGIAVEEGKKDLSKLKLSYETTGNGNVICDMSPKPGISVKEGTKVMLYLGMEKNTNQKVAVPDFTEMTKKEINELAYSLGLKISFMGDGIAVSQDVSPRTEVDKGSQIRVILEQPQD